MKSALQLTLCAGLSAFRAPLRARYSGQTRAKKRKIEPITAIFHGARTFEFEASRESLVIFFASFLLYRIIVFHKCTRCFGGLWN